MRSLSVVFVAALLIAAGNPSLALACSQCLCGTPFPSDVLGGVVPTQITYGIEDRYLSKSNALEEGPGDEKEREHRVAAFGLWRPMNQIALLGRLPYNVKEITERPDGEEESQQTSRGLGDAELFVLAGLMNAHSRMPMSVGLVFGVTAPTGASEKVDGLGERLDAHLQPGAGAWSGTGGIHLAIAGARGVWDASVLGRGSGTNDHGYRYGNVVLYNAGFTSRAWNSVQVLAQINGRSAKRDRFEDGTLGENTGGAVTYLSPGLRYQSGLGFAVEAGVQVPVAQSLYGDQTEHTTGRLALSMSR